MPSSSVSGLVGSVMPSSNEMKTFGGSPDCQALKSSKRRFPRESLERRIWKTRCAFFVGCWTSPSSCISGASAGALIPFSGFDVARANSWRSTKPSLSLSKVPSPATTGLRVQVSAEVFQAVKSNSSPSIMPSPSVSTLFGSPVGPVKLYCSGDM